MEQVQNDPLQKAKLIKEIIHSIALIPDPITRSIYAKEIALKYQLEESLITTEVTRLRSGKWAESVDEPWLKDAPILQPEPIEKPHVSSVQSSSETIEKDLIRIMLKYGDREISTEDRTENLSVSEFIIEDLSKDELSFTHEICRQIYDQILQGISEKIIYTSKYFLRVEDAHIVQITSELIGFEEELSSAWESKYKIYTKHESNDLSNTIIQTLYNFKQAKIAEYIHVLQQQLADETLPPEEFLVILSQQMVYEKIKQQLSTRNGRIILK